MDPILPYTARTRLRLFLVLMVCVGLVVTFTVGSVGPPTHWLESEWPWIAGGGVGGAIAGWGLFQWDRHLHRAGKPAVRRPSTWLLIGIGSLGSRLIEHGTVNQTAVVAGAMGGFAIGLALTASPADLDR